MTNFVIEDMHLQNGTFDTSIIPYGTTNLTINAADLTSLPNGLDLRALTISNGALLSILPSDLKVSGYINLESCSGLRGNGVHIQYLANLERSTATVVWPKHLLSGYVHLMLWNQVDKDARRTLRDAKCLKLTTENLARHNNPLENTSSSAVANPINRSTFVERAPPRAAKRKVEAPAKDTNQDTFANIRKVQITTALGFARDSNSPFKLQPLMPGNNLPNVGNNGVSR